MPLLLNNYCLNDLDDTYILKPDLLEHEHYELLPEKVYKLLDLCYGGGPSIARKVSVVYKSF
jgi:DUSP domain